MRFVRAGVLSGADLPPEPAPALRPGALAEATAALAGLAETALARGRNPELLFLGCHGGDAEREVELARSVLDAIGARNVWPAAPCGPEFMPWHNNWVPSRAFRVCVSACDLGMSRRVQDRFATLGVEGAFAFHPDHVLEYVEFKKSIGSFRNRTIFVVSLQPMRSLSDAYVLAQHRMLVALGEDDIVHREMFVATRDGSVIRERFDEHAMKVLDDAFTVDPPASAAGYPQTERPPRPPEP